MAKDCCFDFDDFPHDELMLIEEQLYNLELLGSEFDPEGRRRSELMARASAILDKYEEAWSEQSSIDFLM